MTGGNGWKKIYKTLIVIEEIPLNVFGKPVDSNCPKKFNFVTKPYVEKTIKNHMLKEKISSKRRDP